MTELFDDVPESLSPYDQWLRKNRIKVDRDPKCPPDLPPWVAARTIRTGPMAANDSMLANFGCEWSRGDWFGTGNTPDEAILDLCNKLDIPLYGADQIKRKDGE